MARIVAGRNGADAIRPEDLALAIFEPPIFEDLAKPVTESLGLPASAYERLKSELEGAGLATPIEHGDLPLAPVSVALLSESERLAEARQQQLNSLHLLLALSSNDSQVRDKLVRVGITVEQIERALEEDK